MLLETRCSYYKNRICVAKNVHVFCVHNNLATRHKFDTYFHVRCTLRSHFSTPSPRVNFLDCCIRAKSPLYITLRLSFTLYTHTFNFLPITKCLNIPFASILLEAKMISFLEIISFKYKLLHDLHGDSSILYSHLLNMPILKAEEGDGDDDDDDGDYDYAPAA